MSAPTVTRLVEADWRAFAALRLRALDDTLGTEDRQYREELAFTASQWRRRLRAHTQFALLDGEDLVGLIGAQRQTVETVYLYSLWLEPQVRGRGLGHDLVSAAVDWACTQGARVVTLRVESGNAAARGIYRRLGFDVVAGEPATDDAAHESAPREITMSRSLG
ncbi:GNAT family N-acetyltransferase [Mycobacterium yunnanensis]|uniref:GNAT family N-acetyltransferase n=1 Tax=Mycobacterium yunnanensis TaxID=368477 RepID=A0A9X3BUP3_9MYCO|nr:GNAT family N-acetyltransferase [Mycobacterium yunnanensis]MCV7422914.1 GNAT family N-acetyltransferase [Mycobacterium yunnanensis]